MDREASPVCMCVVLVKDDDAVGWRVKIQRWRERREEDMLFGGEGGRSRPKWSQE